MKDFRTYQLAVDFYHLCSKLQLRYHLRDQLMRAASSIALNLAEGSGRRSAREQRRFFDIAMGSLRECQAILDLCPSQSSTARKRADSLAAHLYRLIQVVQSRADRG